MPTNSNIILIENKVFTVYNKLNNQYKETEWANKLFNYTDDGIEYNIQLIKGNVYEIKKLVCYKAHGVRKYVNKIYVEVRDGEVCSFDPFDLE